MSIHPTSIVTNSTISESATVGPFCVISDSDIGEGAKIEGAARIDKSKLGKNIIVHWGTIIRESTFGEDCIVGCEVKRSQLGDRNWASHPGTTVGSVKSGNDVNFGSGVKFANYDGKGKGTFTLGSNVFLGCNAVLSVKADMIRTIGNNVKIGASVHVSDDIPNDSLVYTDRETGRLTVREGYLKKV